MIRLTESAATHGCNCLHEMLALVEYEFLIVCMYSLRACILSCALCADPLEVGCELALQLREMRIYVRRVSSESAIAQNIRVANSNRNRNCELVWTACDYDVCNEVPRSRASDHAASQVRDSTDVV